MIEKRRLTDLSWILVSKEKLMLVLERIKQHAFTYKISSETLLMMECSFEGETCYLVVEKCGECSLIHESIKELKKRSLSREFISIETMVHYCAKEIGSGPQSLPMLTDNDVFGQFKTMHGVSVWLNLKAVTKLERCSDIVNQSTTLVSLSPNTRLIIPVQLRYVKQRMIDNLSTYFYYLHLMMGIFSGSDDIFSYYQQRLTDFTPHYYHFVKGSKKIFIDVNYESFSTLLATELVYHLAYQRDKTVERQEIAELLAPYLML
ncbi:hypothetical protein ACWN8B_03360 [Vagococcus zengguangii]|uniref:Uncharacterized protein n=1 Tax=Vagococcus zengguangii TaxID=2571750 RepID=A0A4D7CV30_9ENTE|nr:hypothetical protein [Vagococcus zengguangii]QCI86992.1 hypothetical protein FA707_08440 [Vagococcus zengguangii]